MFPAGLDQTDTQAILRKRLTNADVTHGPAPRRRGMPPIQTLPAQQKQAPDHMDDTWGSREIAGWYQGGCK